MNDKKQELLSFCRYYHGEDECPFDGGVKPLLWDYERVWLSHAIAFEEEGVADDDLISWCSDYEMAGLKPFAKDDNTPMSLVGLLFNRWAHWAYGGGAEEFKVWYVRFYLGKSD